jgi:hypothetical protein
MHPSSTPVSSDVLSVLQHRVLNTPLFPGLKTCISHETTATFIPFISSLLSQTTTSVDIEFASALLPTASPLMITSMIATLPAVCPNLRWITLSGLPMDPVVTTAASEMLLTCDTNTLKKFNVDCPLTEAARRVLYRLPNLSELVSVYDARATSRPPVVLPCLVKMNIKYLHSHEWLQTFHGAALTNLKSVVFNTISPQIGNFLEAFEGAALTTSIPVTLSTFRFHGLSPWNPNYSSLLGFKQLTVLKIETPCRTSCSSTVDDGVVTKLARGLPKLKSLKLGSGPCGTPTGVTTKGLVELSCHCIDLSTLRVHIRAESLAQAAVGTAATPHPKAATAPREECSLTTLEVGNTPIPGDSMMVIALALLQIFPRIEHIQHVNPKWKPIESVIKISGRLSNRIGAMAHSSSEALHNTLSKLLTS